MNNYFQRLAAQTWGLAPSPTVADAPQHGVQSQIMEVHDEVIAPATAVVAPTLSSSASPLPPVEAGTLFAPPPSTIIEAPPHRITNQQELTIAQRVDEVEVVNLETRAPAPASSPSEARTEPGTPVPPRVPPHLNGILPASPMMDEVIRWLAAPPVLIGEESNKALIEQVSQQRVEEIVSIDEAPAASPREAAEFRTIPSRSIPSTNEQRHDFTNDASPARRTEPDVIVSIGSVQVTIEAPPPAPQPTRNIERPQPAPVATVPRDRRSALSRRYL